MKKSRPIVDKKNFGEYTQKICQMEHRRKKLLAKRTCAGWTSGAAFFIAALSTAYSMADLIEMPLIPQLRFLGDSWNNLCAFFLPKGYSPQEAFLFSILATILISLAVHLMTALAVGLAYSEKPSAPLEGKDSKQAAELQARCASAGTRLPPRKKTISILISAAYALVLLLPTLLDRNEMLRELEKTGLGTLTLSLALIVVIFGLLYAVPYAIFLWLNGFLYRIHRKYEWEYALDTYASLCIAQEQEQKRAEEERKRTEQEEQDRRQGDSLYRQAIAGQKVDDQLVWQAAELGSRPACLYLARQMMEAWSIGAYTKEEKADIAEVAKNFFYTASLEETFKESKIEAKFGYLMFLVLTESGNASKWRGVLSQLRDVQNSGLLPERYQKTCSMLIDTVVDMVDASDAKEAAFHQNSSSQPVVKRCYCKFFNAGACGWSSTDGYSARCSHVSNPGQCSIALMNHGLEFEFE